MRERRDMTQTPSYRELRRSQTDRKISGVCGGIADYLNVDPNLVRLAVIGLTIITGGAFALAYLIAIVVMPDSPRPAPVWNYPTDQPGGYPPPNGQHGQQTPPPGAGGPGNAGGPAPWSGTTPQGEPFPGYPGATTGPATPRPNDSK